LIPGRCGRATVYGGYSRNRSEPCWSGEERVSQFLSPVLRMTTYWLAFRIEAKTVGNRSWEDRYNALIAAIERNSTQRWFETTSFIAFESISSIDGLAYKLKGAIAPSKDMFLLRVMDARTARLCGRFDDQTIFKVMPYLEVI
jgi:hypothetical protein